MKHRTFLSLFIMICVTLFPTAQNNQITTESTLLLGEQIESKLNSQIYVEHAAIHIASDEDFETQAWPGNGTEVNPFRIEGLNITTDLVCVNITGTNVFFLIQDCLFASSSNDDYYGVILRNVSHGMVKDCIITMLDTGIYVTDSGSTDIKNNTIFNVQSGISSWELSSCNISLNIIYNCSWGIQSWSANDTLLLHNTIYDYFLYGVTIGGLGTDNLVAYNEIYSSNYEHLEAAIRFDSPAWIIEHNSIHDCVEGIEIWFSGFMTGRMIIRENTFQRVGSAFVILWGIDIVIIDNTIADCVSGIVLWESENCEIIGNVFTNTTFRTIDVTDSMNCTITGNTMESAGIRIRGSTLSMWRHSISGNTVGGKQLGYFLNTEDTEIDGNSYGQIFLVNCTSIEIEGGVLHDVMTGVSIAFSERCVIKDVEIHHTFVTGISLIFSDHCRIQGCRIYNNSHFYMQRGGILLDYVINCTLVENYIYLNTGSGVSSEYGAPFNNCTIMNNAIYNNTRFGIRLQSGSRNTIYGNAIGWNEENNAQDDGSDNSWDDGVSIGNWWSDYNTTLGGTYNITGDAESVDRFPNILPSGIPSLPLEDTSEPPVIDPIIIITIGGVALVVVVIVIRKRK